MAPDITRHTCASRAATESRFVIVAELHTHIDCSLCYFLSGAFGSHWVQGAETEALTRAPPNVAKTCEETVAEDTYLPTHVLQRLSWENTTHKMSYV